MKTYTFSVLKCISFGQAIYISGSSEQLGCWDPQKALKLHWTEVYFDNNFFQNHCWQLLTGVTMGLCEYKYLIADFNEPTKVFQWESGPNRFIGSRGQDLSVQQHHIADKWNDRIVKLLLTNRRAIESVHITGSPPGMGSFVTKLEMSLVNGRFETEVQLDIESDKQVYYTYSYYQFGRIREHSGSFNICVPETSTYIQPAKIEHYDLNVLQIHLRNQFYIAQADNTLFYGIRHFLTKGSPPTTKEDYRLLRDKNVSQVVEFVQLETKKVFINNGTKQNMGYICINVLALIREFNHAHDRYVYNLIREITKSRQHSFVCYPKRNYLQFYIQRYKQLEQKDELIQFPFQFI